MGSLRAIGLVKTFDRGRIRALDGIDLVVDQGEFLSVTGPSGSGKSTLLHVLGTLERPDEGRVLLDGVDLLRENRLDRVRARSIGFVFQLHHLLPALTALENVEVPLRALSVPRRERRRRATALLEAVALADRVQHLPDELSGGERQRVALARALVNEPKLLLADEPTGNIDRAAGRRVLELLESLRERRELTLVLVTHDRQIAERADRTVHMIDGRLVESGR
jgi:putative ABC transport system ATP-binding protein